MLHGVPYKLGQQRAVNNIDFSLFICELEQIRNRFRVETNVCELYATFVCVCVYEHVCLRASLGGCEYMVSICVYSTKQSAQKKKIKNRESLLLIM